MDYIAPEQVTDSHWVDCRTDIYSLGCTFYYLLTGVPPFDGVSALEKLMRHQDSEPLPIEERRPGLPNALAVIIRRMMAKHPDDRYRSTAEVAEVLKPFCLADVSPATSLSNISSPPNIPSVSDPTKQDLETTGDHLAPGSLFPVQPAPFPAIALAPPSSSPTKSRKSSMVIAWGAIAAGLIISLVLFIVRPWLDDSRGATHGPESERTEVYPKRVGSGTQRDPIFPSIPNPATSPRPSPDPKTAEKHRLRGDAFRDNKQYDRAIPEYTHAIEIDLNCGWAFHGRGDSYSGKGEHDLAIADYTQAIALIPRPTWPRTNRGWSYFQKGNLDEALADFDEAIRLDPMLAAPYRHRADLFDRKGDPVHAKSDRERADRLEPPKN